jgi:hypothetical protein
VFVPTPEAFKTSWFLQKSVAVVNRVRNYHTEGIFTIFDYKNLGIGYCGRHPALRPSARKSYVK